MAALSKHNKYRLRQLIKSILLSILLMLLCYFADNSPYSFVGGPTTGQRIEQLELLLGKQDDTLPSDFYLINVAYDKQLIPLTDSFGMTMGKIDITDRQRLSDLLTELKKTNYKYIILDVLFDEKWQTPADSALYSLISSMDRIVVAKSHTAAATNRIPASKLRYSDYSTHIAESNFVKYEYIRDGEPTLPYQMYLDLYGDSIDKYGWLYTFKGLPAHKSVVLRHPIKLWDNMKRDSDAGITYALESRFPNLGSDILDAGVDIPKAAEGKIVVIGDFTEDDIHATYIGPIAGPAIILNAFLALTHDDLSIPKWLIAFQLMLYIALSYCILRKYSLKQAIPILNKIKSKVTLLFISFLSITTLLSAVAAVIYLTVHTDINVFIPSLWFTAMITIVNLRKRIDNL